MKYEGLKIYLESPEEFEYERLIGLDYVEDIKIMDQELYNYLAPSFTPKGSTFLVQLQNDYYKKLIKSLIQRHKTTLELVPNGNRLFSGCENVYKV